MVIWKTKPFVAMYQWVNLGLSKVWTLWKRKFNKHNQTMSPILKEIYQVSMKTNTKDNYKYTRTYRTS